MRLSLAPSQRLQQHHQATSANLPRPPPHHPHHPGNSLISILSLLSPSTSPNFIPLSSSSSLFLSLSSHTLSFKSLNKFPPPPPHSALPRYLNSPLLLSQMDRAQSRSSFDDPHNLSLQDIHHFDNNSTDSLSLLSHSNHASRADPSHAIDINAIGAGLQRYIPPSSHNSYIPLPPGVDPATVDFRTFYPYNPDQVKHRKRTTRSQLKVLEDRFKHETKPNAMIRKKLAAELGMTPRGVQVCCFFSSPPRVSLT